MFRQLFLVQWKWTRAALLAICLLVAITPALSMRIAISEVANLTPNDLVSLCVVLGFGLSLFAVITGIAVQDASWRPDVNGRYVYALSLPLPWRDLLLRRLAGGLMLLVLPALALWLGGWLATSLVAIPSTLHTYAGGVAMRFFLASALSYAAWSVLVRFSGQRASLVVLLLLLAALVVPLATIALFGATVPADTLLRFFADPPGPLSVFFSRWAIIDV
jgi:hypothetical protein